MLKRNKISSTLLMEQIKRSNQKAFGVLYDRLSENMYTKAISILCNESKAKDIVQEVWINFWERRQEIKNDNIEGYLFNALRFKIYNEFRNSKNYSILRDEYIKSYNENTASNNIEENINLTDTEKLINNGIEKLPKKCRQVFELSRNDGLKNDEIAFKLNISQRTVETHISNAIKVLKSNIVIVLIFTLSNF